MLLIVVSNSDKLTSFSYVQEHKLVNFPITLDTQYSQAFTMLDLLFELVIE